MPYKVTAVTRILDISATAVRQWTAEFSSQLDPEASPGKGGTRVYSDSDLEVLATIKALRAQGIDYAEIHSQLDSGNRVAFTPPDTPESTGDESTAVALMETLRSYETRVETLTDRLIEAESRAAAAEKEAEILREVLDSQTAGKPKSFWGRLFNRD